MAVISGWIETERGLSQMSLISNIFYASIANEDDDNGDIEPRPTHGVWATLASGDNVIIFQGTEDQAQAIVEGLRENNNATNLDGLIPAHLFPSDDDE